MNAITLNSTIVTITVFAAALIQSSQMSAAELEFKLHVVNAQSLYSSCAAFDVNKDGHIDIFSGGYWYEGPEFKQSHFVREVEMIGKGVPRADGYSHLVMDVNRDGWMDVVHVNFRSSSIYWLENPGTLPNTWKKHMVEEPGQMETGRLYDVDGDGQLDIVPSPWAFSAWWELLPAKPGVTAKFARYDITKKGGGHGSGFGDVNGDGRGDYIGTKGWAEGPSDPRNGNWIWHAEFEIGRTSMPIIVSDPDEDGDNDLIYGIGHDYGVYWLEQTNVKGKRQWNKHLIDDSWSQGHAPLWADLDNNGHNEYVTGKRYWAHEGRDPGARDPLVIYRYEFDKKQGKFLRYTIQSNGPAGTGLDPKAVDLDADGDLDLVLPGRSGLYYYENMLTSK
jgi:hypothetical protein